MSDSFLVKPDAQPDLLPMATESVFSELEAKGEFTGERLFAKRPDTYKAIVVLLSQKRGLLFIGRLLNVSPNTVAAVRDREGVSIESIKEHLARVAHAGATLASEGILDALNDILQRKHCLGVKDLKELAVVYGILVQNGQLLSGQPTARLEVQEVKAPDHNDFNEYIRRLPAIHLVGETAGTKEPQKNGPREGDQAADLAGADPIGPTDEQSEGLEGKGQ